MKKSQPIRMCISCRARNPQHTMIRLKQSNQKIVLFDGTGRSMYVCYGCIQNEKKVKGLVKRFKQDKEYFTKLLKELIDNG